MLPLSHPFAHGVVITGHLCTAPTYSTRAAHGHQPEAEYIRFSIRPVCGAPVAVQVEHHPTHTAKGAAPCGHWLRAVQWATSAKAGSLVVLQAQGVEDAEPLPVNPSRIQAIGPELLMHALCEGAPLIFPPGLAALAKRNAATAPQTPAPAEPDLFAGVVAQ